MADEALRDDLEGFMRERVNTLGNDMLWRCKESGLVPGEFYYILLTTFLHSAANIIADSLPSEHDPDVVRCFYHMIGDARADRSKSK